MRGYSAIGLDHPKNAINLGGVLRAAYCYRAAMVAVSGNRIEAHKLIDSPSNNLRSEKHIPILRGEDLHDLVPFDCVPVAVDLVDGAVELQNYQHPQRAFYIFGPEDGTLGIRTLSWCRDRVMIPTRTCMNLAATVNVVLYDRLAKNLIAQKYAEKSARKAAAIESDEAQISLCHQCSSQCEDPDCVSTTSEAV